jgi:drug/metabolite transporter (DMT)-like permease
MTIGSLAYVVNDSLVRRITEDGPDVYQVLCMRSIALAIIFAVLGRLRGEHTVRAHLRRPLISRVLAEMVASSLFFAALVRMEFANAQAILQIVPFAVTLAAAVILKERVSARQYATIVLGFVGVLLVIRPATESFTLWSIAAVGTATLMIVREFATRRVNKETPAMSIAFVTAVGMSLITGALSLLEGWRALTMSNVVDLAFSVSFLAVGYVLTIQTVRIGDLSVSAPFRYLNLVGAAVIGYLMFAEVPDTLTVIGITLIMATGIYAVHLESRATAVARIAVAA